MRSSLVLPCALLGALLGAGCGSSNTVSPGKKGSASASAGTNAGTTGSASATTGGGSNSTGTTGTTSTSGAATTTSTSGVSTSGSSGGCGLRTCHPGDCGPIGDGCGGTLQCSTCPAGQYCGGGGPSKCGAIPCTKTTCAAKGANCGVIADGCGGTLDCDPPGGCPAGQFCGGGGPNVCGSAASSCVPRTCNQAGANCGQVADGCGGLTPDCGSCTGQDICGGGGTPSVCGSSNRPDSGATCTNLCLKQTQCPTGTTHVTGKVYAPNGVDPIYGALVYVPNGPVQPFTPGVACLKCDAQVSGSPLVATTTAADGSFDLGNMPVGSNIPLVIQVGRWRRQVTIASVAACTATAVPAADTRLPKNQAEGDIPLTAMVTGSADALQCVLRKIGIDDSEFTDPAGAGRIRVYTAAGGPGATLDANTPDDTGLIGSASELSKYDVVIFACEGGEYGHGATELTNVLNYANAGGRIFATHYSYTWLHTPQTWDAAATWNTSHGLPSTASITGTLDVSFPKGQAFSSWLDNVGASTAPGSGQVNIDNWRWDVDGVLAPPAPAQPTQAWINASPPGGGSSVQHLTFNTPYAAAPAQQCGRVLFSDFHVTGGGGGGAIMGCSNTGMTKQEHILEFMLFDIASCIAPDNAPPPVCNKITQCSQVGANCGLIGDGCGGTLDCGGCPSGQSCGGGGTPSVCGASSCVPKTCAQLGINCGPSGDGCGGTIQCPACPSGQSCGGGGTPNVCGTPPCTPVGCPAGANCGVVANGCGGTVSCGTCTAPATCGGNGTPNVCGGVR